MNTNTPTRRRIPKRIAVIAAALTGALVVAACGERDGDTQPQPFAAPAAVLSARQQYYYDVTHSGPAPDADDQTAERARLREIVAKMPSGWPATEVMRRAAGQP